MSNGQLFPALKQVYLYDWWLIKPGPNQLAVGGFTFKGRRFQSTAIAKRRDAVTIQTIDGTVILVSGCINRSRTLQNGFSCEVCNQFLVGFPYNWEEFGAVSFGEPTDGGPASRNSGFSINEDAASRTSVFSTNEAAPADGTSSSFSKLDDHLPSADGPCSSSSISVDLFPACILKDILVSSVRNSEGGMLRESILDEIVHKYSSNAFNADEASSLNQKTDKQVTKRGLPLDSQENNAKANQNREDSGHLPDATSGNEEFQKATPQCTLRNSIGEPSCLNQKNNNQVKSKDHALDETPSQKKKATANLRKEDENQHCGKDVFHSCNPKSGAGIGTNNLSGGPLTRGKASLYKIATVNEQQEEERCVHTAESGLGDSRIVNDSPANGPLTRSKAKKIHWSRKK